MTARPAEQTIPPSNWLLVGLARELKLMEPMPPPANSGNDRKVVLRGLVRAESMVQIALALPLSTFIGWGLGDYLGNKLHHSWIAVVGLLLGVVAGFVQVIRLANHANRSDEN